MIDDVADVWLADYTSGNETLVVCDTVTTAADVSAACQQRLIAADRLGDEVAIGADANPIRIGDLLQTRDNTVELYTTDGRRVLNREVWKVTGPCGATRPPIDALTAILAAPGWAPRPTLLSTRDAGEMSGVRGQDLGSSAELSIVRLSTDRCRASRIDASERVNGNRR